MLCVRYVFAMLLVCMHKFYKVKLWISLCFGSGSRRIYVGKVALLAIVIWDKVKYWVVIWIHKEKEFWSLLFYDLVRVGYLFCSLVMILLRITLPPFDCT